jgi:hypothetical protein
MEVAMTDPLRRIAWRRAALLMTLIVVGCMPAGAAQPPVSEGALIQRLRTLSATYTWDKELERYVFSAKVTLESLLKNQSPERELHTLVNCLRDAAPSNTTLDDKPIALGVICYEALTQVAYYEPTAPNGDVAADWPGIITPKASVAELAAAYKAWKKVLAKHAYILL